MIVYFAGGENKATTRQLKEAGVKNVLMSYYYIKHRNVDIEYILNTFENVVIDSGAFTMGAGHGVKKGDTAIHLHQEFLEDYLDFLYRYVGRFFWVANYDLDNDLGTYKIMEWNRLFEELERHGQRVCYVTHDLEQTYPNLYRYFNRYDFIGVSGDHKLRKDYVGYFSRVYDLSFRTKKLVHGFAMTNFISFQKFPFYSADSTTYLGGAKFGSTYVWNGAYFETWDYYQKHRRKNLKIWCDKWGIDYKKFINEDSHEITKFNIKSWLENEKSFNKLTKPKQWWLNDKTR